MAVNVGMQQLRVISGLALVVLACACCVLPTLSGAQPTTSTSPALQPSGDSQLPVPAAAAAASAAAVGAVAPSATTSAVPATTTTSPTTAAATASKKLPLASPHDVFEPAAEVVSALPVPIPETFPSASGFGGFDPEGYGGQTVPGGGLGGYNGGYNGGYGGYYCCGGPGGGFGYGNGLGYNNFFNSAPAAAAGSLRLAAMAALLVTLVFAMF